MTAQDRERENRSGKRNREKFLQRRNLEGEIPPSMVEGAVL